MTPHRAAGSLTWWEWDGVLVAFPVVAYGFCAHQILFSIYSSMRSASLKRMTGVIQRSMLMSSVVYVVVGGCGFLAFGQRCAGQACSAQACNTHWCPVPS